MRKTWIGGGKVDLFWFLRRCHVLRLLRRQHAADEVLRAIPRLEGGVAVVVRAVGLVGAADVERGPAVEAEAAVAVAGDEPRGSVVAPQLARIGGVALLQEGRRAVDQSAGTEAGLRLRGLQLQRTVGAGAASALTAGKRRSGRGVGLRRASAGAVPKVRNRAHPAAHAVDAVVAIRIKPALSNGAERNPVVGAREVEQLPAVVLVARQQLELGADGVGVAGARSNDDEDQQQHEGWGPRRRGSSSGSSSSSRHILCCCRRRWRRYRRGRWSAVELVRY